MFFEVKIARVGIARVRQGAAAPPYPCRTLASAATQDHGLSGAVPTGMQPHFLQQRNARLLRTQYTNRLLLVSRNNLLTTLTLVCVSYSETQ
jgi:hypothetical protein